MTVLTLGIYGQFLYQEWYSSLAVRSQTVYNFWPPPCTVTTVFMCVCLNILGLCPINSIGRASNL